MRLLLALAFVGQILAQPSFDVASVKPSPDGEPMSLSPLTGGRFKAGNIDVKTLIRAAYQVQDFQILSAPSWVESARFNIDAKSDTAANAEQTRVMLQTLLADRFQLKIRRDSKEMTAYALVVPNGSANKLTPADKTGCEPDPLSPTNPCEHIRSSAGFVLNGEKVSMPLFCKVLGSLLRQTVVDKNGLDGVFDFKLDLGRAGFAPTPGASGSEMDGIAALMAGLQDQLGLKLERTKSGVEILVIEHVEKPTEN